MSRCEGEVMGEMRDAVFWGEKGITFHKVLTFCLIAPFVRKV
jgi:hypothetical protein